MSQDEESIGNVCSSCNTRLKENASFCSNCGKKVIGNSAVESRNVTKIGANFNGKF